MDQPLTLLPSPSSGSRVKLDELVGQKPDRPTLMPGRSLRTSQGREACVEGSIKGRLPGFAVRLAGERRFQSLFDKTLFEMLHRARGHTQSRGDIGHFPGISKLACVT